MTWMWKRWVDKSQVNRRDQANVLAWRMLINFANEVLQVMFVKEVLVAERERYADCDAPKALETLRELLEVTSDGYAPLRKFPARDMCPEPLITATSLADEAEKLLERYAKTPGAAHARAEEIGCSTVHQNNGKWMPCADEQELHRQLRKH